MVFAYFLLIGCSAILPVLGLHSSQSISSYGSVRYSEIADYVIYIENSIVKAKNGTTGAIDFSDPDASTVINNAIGNLKNGGKIFIQQGTYTITNTIEIDSNICLEGSGWSTVLIGHIHPLIENLNYEGPNCGVFNENITIRNMKLDAGRPCLVSCNIQMCNVSNVLLQNLYLKSSRNDAISFCAEGLIGSYGTAEYVTMDHLIFEDIGVDAIAAHCTSHLTIHDILVKDCGQDEAVANGITIGAGTGAPYHIPQYITISDCVFNNQKSSGLLIVDALDVTVDNVVVNGTDNDSGIMFRSEVGDGCKNVICTNSLVMNAVGNGFEVWDSQDIHLVNCTAINCSDPSHTYKGHGFMIGALDRNCRNVSLEHCYTSYNGKNGIRIRRDYGNDIDVDNITVVNCEGKNNGQETGDYDFIRVTGDWINYVTITNCVGYDDQDTKTQRDGVRLSDWSAKYTTIIGNRFVDNAGYGIVVGTGVQNTYISDNDLRGNIKGAISDSGTNTTITDSNEF